MVMQGSLDFFSLFVEYVFGNLLFTIVGLTIILAVICMISRMSLLLMSAFVVLFLLCMLVGFFGGIVAVIIFAFSAIYFFMSLIPWIRGWIG